MPPSKPQLPDRTSAPPEPSGSADAFTHEPPAAAATTRRRHPAKASKPAPGPLATIGERLLELRTKRSLSQAAVASAVGVNRATYGLWESGATIPEISKVEALSEFLTAPREYIAFGIIGGADGEVTCVVPFVEISGDGSYRKLGNWGIPRFKLAEIGLEVEDALVVRVEKQRFGVNLSELCLVDKSVKNIDDSGNYIVLNNDRAETIKIKNLFDKYYAIGEDWSVEINAEEYCTFGKIKGFLWTQV